MLLLSRFFVAFPIRVKGKRERFLLGILVCISMGVFGADDQGPLFSYTVRQSDNGRVLYKQHCKACHGSNLDDGPFGPPLKGPKFAVHWNEKTVGSLLNYVEKNMPPGADGIIERHKYIDILAYLFQQDGIADGSTPLPTKDSELALINYISRYQSEVDQSVVNAEPIVFPSPELSPNPLDDYTPVSDEMLTNPPKGDWLTWRRGNDGHGYSPLDQITTKNVNNLRLAWSWALPSGQSQTAPLVHDGVMFVQSNKDNVQAFNAVTGDLLWHYSRSIPDGMTVTSLIKRAIALYDDNLYLAASDGFVVALEATTGNVAWETEVFDHKLGLDLELTGGGPVIARGKVMVGTRGSQGNGNFIIGLDAKTGEESWRVNTIARMDDKGGDSWSGATMEKRTGASVWVPGSYDPQLNLSFWGTGNSYDTKLLGRRDNALNNDALHTNSTLAINPDTGKIKWSYQHHAGDLLNQDWAFERPILHWSKDKESKDQKVVVATGKLGISDLLRADNGQYLASYDVGFQNVVADIDSVTGSKLLSPGMAALSSAHYVCSARSWMPSAYDVAAQSVYIATHEYCADHSSAPGEYVVSNIDGLHGQLQAVDLASLVEKWRVRQRVPFSSGVLSTAGGLLFVGSYDRRYAAYDSLTGAKLWSTRLNDMPNSPPISYQVDGKQYLAMTVGGGSIYQILGRKVAPEIQNPPGGGATVWVFELQE